MASMSEAHPAAGQRVDFFSIFCAPFEIHFLKSAFTPDSDSRVCVSHIPEPTKNLHSWEQQKAFFLLPFCSLFVYSFVEKTCMAAHPKAQLWKIHNNNKIQNYKKHKA